jgi:hypothetical protein
MRTSDKGFALAYFENKALRARMKGFQPNAKYRWTWFEPVKGTWSKPIQIESDGAGSLMTPPFPSFQRAMHDVGAKIVLVP